MPSTAARTLLFDLDGTLVDPAKGIIGAFRSALMSLGHQAPAFETLGWVIGPPLRESFPKLMGDDPRVEEAVAAYRLVYSGGLMFEATPYPGVREVLARFKARGDRMIVCTAKPRPFALRVLERFDLSGFFSAVYGAELDGRFDDKADLMAHLVARERVAAPRACMIGDRAFDILAAKANGIASIGVLWGYGGEAELRAAGADALCGSPAEIEQRVETLMG